MRMLVVVLALVTLQVAEQRVFVVEGPTSTEATIGEPLQGFGVLDGEPAAVADVPPTTGRKVLLSVLADDVEALGHYLRTHYRHMWLRASPLTHLDAELVAGGQCDPDECYSNCYLQGFRGGNCKENKCFCTQVPPAPPVNLDTTTT